MWKSIFSQMARTVTKTGQLQVTFPDGSSAAFGDLNAKPIRMRINNKSTLRALCLDPELAMGEAYMDGSMTIEDDDLSGLLAMAMQNFAHTRHAPTMTIMDKLRRAIRLFQQRNPIGRAQSNVKHHYDLSDELYRMFLDADRQYSCAYFENSDLTLEAAQLAKKNHIAKKLLLHPGLSILDIGSGWGGMGLTLAKDFGCQVFGVTLSPSQHKVSTQRADEEGISDRAQFALMDYRSVEQQFDRVVSVGMFEHVGVPHYREFFRHLHRLLKSDGVALLHTIGRSSPPSVTNAWIAKYIFPGGYIPAMSEVVSAIEKEGLIVTDIEVLRLHYAETLKEWHRRFVDQMDRVREIYDDQFCRMWKFYLIASEMAFRYGHDVVFQFQITKQVDKLPLTRNYMYAPS